jgi:hypothetical protein
MRQSERDKWMNLLETEREAHRKERQELLNRIAAPAHIQVDTPAEPRQGELMTMEDIELSFVGGEVPDGIDVGSLREQNGNH